MKTLVASRIFDDTFLNPYRQTGDAAADAVIEQLAAEQGKKGLGDFMQFLGNFSQLTITHLPPFVQNFFELYSRLPAFAHRGKMDKGMAFFWKYDQQIALLLGCYSLPYCYAAADGAQVLWLSQRIKNDTFKRLEETGEFVFGIMQERDWKNGRNTLKILKIRLMHAVIRYFTNHSEQWDQVWGLPINQEDMAGTNLAFSYVVIRGLRTLGIQANTADEEAYLHFWNVVGSLLGLQNALLPLNLREAYHLDRAIVRRHFKTSEAGTGLTKSLTKTLKQQTPEPDLQNFPVAQMRFLLGDSVADLLAIPRVPFEENVIRMINRFPMFSALFRSRKTSSGVIDKYSRN
ncbi:oxygenase MpaB family protein [Runella sp.]|uniref:oxygenase MpaB family protein n=1 Tax=Runella sp. TaxID=1960881 RepID=UPI003D1093D0